MYTYTLQYLSQYLDADLDGDAEFEVNGLSSLISADEKKLSLYMGGRYKDQLKETQAGCIVLNESNTAAYKGNKLVVANPYLSYAKLSELFAYKPLGNVGIHPTAVVADNAIIGSNVSIGANTVVEENTQILDNSHIGAGVYIGEGVIIGKNTTVHANVTIHHDVVIGDDCIFHSGSVIGADGFGFAPSSDGWQKIHQLGSVFIGNNVDIGANTAVDRGALDDTTIGDGVKIDNLVQIGHNVKIGEATAIASKTGVAGSSIIGKRCTIAGAVGIAGHLSIADDVHITGMTLVSKSIPKAGSYSSGTTMTTTREWRKNAVRFNQLDKLARQVKSIK